MKPERYSVWGPVKGICKQSAVWVHESNTSAPLFYIGRPKWIKDDNVWQAIVDSIQIDLRVNEVK
jgi:hypothetical protein